MKFFAALGFLVLTLSGCSETPTTPMMNTMGYNGYNAGYGTNGYHANGYTNGIYTNGIPPQNGNYYNPYLANPNYCQQNAMVQSQMQAQAQLMWSWQFRMNHYSSFYYPMTQANTCLFKRFPTYTRDRCAGSALPLSCDQVIANYHTTTTRRGCVVRHRRTVIVHHTSGSSSGNSGDNSNSGSNPSDDNTNPSGPNQDYGDDQGSKTTSSGSESSVNPAHRIEIELKDEEDAKALYVRLGLKDEHDVDSKGRDIDYPIHKTGLGYHCFKGKKDAEYKCDLSINADDGSLLVWDVNNGRQRIYDPNAAELKVDISTPDYVGKEVSILRQDSKVAVIKLNDTRFEQLFNRLQKDPNDSNVAIGKQMKVTKKTDVNGTSYEVEIRTSIEKGEPIEVVNWK